MAITYKRYIFKGGTGAGLTEYIADRGTTISNVASRFAIPTDMTDAQADAIVAAIGAEPILPSTVASPCPIAYNATWRKVRFVRKNGNSFSLIMPARDTNQIITRATAVKTIVNGLSSGAHPLECAILEGESYPNFYDVIAAESGAASTTFATSTPTTPNTTAHPGMSKVYYSGVLAEYKSDAVWDSVHPQPIKVISELKTAPPNVLSMWADCVGTLVNASCAASDARSHRYYTVTLAITGNKEETLQMPVTDNAATAIMECGKKLVELASSICLAYQGERYSLLHLLI